MHAGFWLHGGRKGKLKNMFCFLWKEACMVVCGKEETPESAERRGIGKFIARLFL